MLWTRVPGCYWASVEDSCTSPACKWCCRVAEVPGPRRRKYRNVRECVSWEVSAHRCHERSAPFFPRRSPLPSAADPLVRIFAPLPTQVRIPSTRRSHPHVRGGAFRATRCVPINAARSRSGAIFVGERIAKSSLVAREARFRSR